MADPVTLVILVAAGEAATPGVSAMAQGARDAFAGTVAEVREARGTPTDADAAAIEDESHPDAVAELVWRDADHRRATLRVHLRRSARWIERSFTFGAADPAPERGRALGFAVAAILPEIGAGARSATAPATWSGWTAPATGSSPAPANAPTTAGAPAPAPPPGPPATSSSTAAPEPATATAPAAPGPTTPTTAATATASASKAPAARPAPFVPASALAAESETSSPSTAAEPEMTGTPRDVARPPRIGVDLLGAVATSSGGTATTEGGGGAIEWFLHPRFSLRLGAVARAGTIDVAEARTTTVVTSAGVVLHPWQATRANPFAVTIRVDYILARESATHFDSDDPSPVSLSRWVSGVDTFVDAELLLSSQIAAVAGIGLEDVWAPTYIYVRDERVAALQPLRGVAEAGFQLRF